MRTISIAYTVTVEMDVPDDFPVSAEEIHRDASYSANDYCDGRHPFSTEMMFDAAERAAVGHVESAIFHHYCNKIEKWFGQRNVHIEGRNSLIAKWSKSVRHWGARSSREGGMVTVRVTDEYTQALLARQRAEYESLFGTT